MKNFRICALVVTLFLGLTLLAACEKKEPPPPPAPAPASRIETPVPVTPIEPPIAVSSEQPTAAPSAPPSAALSAPSTAAPAEASATPTETQAAISFPAECEGYLAQMNECINKLGDNTADADALKKQMERTRASWAQLSNPDALGVICKQASEAFTQRSKEKGC